MPDGTLVNVKCGNDDNWGGEIFFMLIFYYIIYKYFYVDIYLHNIQIFLCDNIYLHNLQIFICDNVGEIRNCSAVMKNQLAKFSDLR